MTVAQARLFLFSPFDGHTVLIRIVNLYGVRWPFFNKVSGTSFTLCNHINSSCNS